MKHFKIQYVIAVLAIAAFFGVVSLPAQEQRGPAGTPPPVKACEGKSAGDACSFQTKDGSTKSDVCKKVKSPKGEEELSCGDMPKPPAKGKK